MSTLIDGYRIEALELGVDSQRSMFQLMVPFAKSEGVEKIQRELEVFPMQYNNDDSNYSQEYEKIICFGVFKSDLIQRLDLLGITVEQAALDFDTQFYSFFAQSAEIVSVEEYRKASRIIIARKLFPTMERYVHPDRPDFRARRVVVDKSIRCPIQRSLILNGFKTFPHSSPLFLLRNLIENLESKAFIEFKITAQRDHGLLKDNVLKYIEENEVNFQAPNGFVKKISVFSEGKTDSHILSKAMRLMYPNLSSFYDFQGLSVFNGGAPILTRRIEALTGLGLNIKNRIIAVYDNDIEGNKQLEYLDAISSIANVCFFCLPPIDLLTNYPVHDGMEVVRMDLNGLAGFIEMYLGEQILLEKGGLIELEMANTRFRFKDGKNKGAVLKRFERFVDLHRNESPMFFRKRFPELHSVIKEIIDRSKNF